MVTATLRVVVPGSKRGEVLQALRSVRGPTEAHGGCCGYHVYQDDGDENALYRTVLAIIETASEPPDIRFDTARRGRQRQAAGGGRPRKYANAAAGAAAGS